MKRITFLIASFLLLVACNNEVEQNFNIPETDAQQIKLNLPDATILTYSTATPTECWIDDLWVLEFNTGGTSVNNTLISGANIVNNGHATQMLPPLPFKPANGNTIVLLANTGVTSLPAGVVYYADINTDFLLKSPNAKEYYVEGDTLPMYGEITGWPGTNAYACDMIRAVAKIQVKLGETFTNESGIGGWPNDVSFEFYNYTAEGYIKPSVTGRTNPAGNATSNQFKLLQNPSAMQTVYVYEYNSSTSNIEGDPVNSATFDAKRPFLLLKDGVGAYYRLDFYDSYMTSPTREQFVDIKRNCHYIFTINKVNSQGYSSDTEAIALPGSNIEYTVEAPNGFDYVTSNGQYAIVTSVDTAYVAADTTNATIATARYVLPAEISPAEMAAALGAGMTNTVSVTTGTTGLTLTPMTLSNVSQDVKVTTSSFTQGTIEFKLGNVKHTLVVMKK